MTIKSPLGDLLHDLRRRRRLSLRQLCERAQLSMRTVEYWEAGQRSPRMPELEAALNALEVTPSERAQVFASLTTPRGIHLARMTMQSEMEEFDAAQDIGGLMRAMRLRQGWSIERLSEEMGISRQTVYRWETMRNFPSEEHLLQVCRILNAAEEEMAALSGCNTKVAAPDEQCNMEVAVHHEPGDR